MATTEELLGRCVGAWCPGATGIDKATGRPIEDPAARYADKPMTVFPSGLGAHAWMPMSYSPKTGLVYLPAMEVALTYGDNVHGDIHYGRWNTGGAFANPDPAAEAETKGLPRGELIAWDPIRQKEVWRH